MRLEITLMIQIEVGNNGPPYYRTEGMHLTRQFTTIYSRPQHVTSSKFDIQGSQVYTSSSLPPLSLSLSEVLLSDSSPVLPEKRSSDSKRSCNVYFATTAENRCGRDAGGGGGGGGGVSSLHTGFCVIWLLLCRFHKLIQKLLPIEPQRHKFTVHISDPPRSTRVHLRKPMVHAMLVLVTLKISSSYVLFCTFRIRQN